MELFNYNGEAAGVRWIMLLSSIYYFLYFGAVAFLFPFLALFYKAHGLTGSQMGELAAVSPLISFFGAPLWNGVADASHRHKLTAVVAVLGVVTIAFVFPNLATFAAMLVMICLYSFFNSPTGSLVDSAVMALLGDRKERYGRIRLWGTVGYGVIAPIASIAIGRYGVKWAFWGYALIMAVGLLVLIPLPFRQSQSNRSFFGGMRQLFSHRAWVLFLVMVFIAGAGMATYNNYFLVYMQSLGSSSALMGLALTIATASEVPAMFFSDRILRRFGARGMLIIAMSTIGLRLLAYSATSATWLILLIQVVHGLTFAAVYTAGVYFADQVAPPGMKATAQGMFNGTLMGFGAGAGGLLGGVLMDRFSPSTMYAAIGGSVLVGLFVFLLFERRLSQKQVAEIET